ncbi:MAG TPA: CoA pyrophosphatase [Flavobacteriales bacterium]|nr:CoA pyrophosphatase [Flavobacteriales bacterium]
MNTDRNTLIERLKNRLRAPLPGHDAFLELSGYRRPDLATAMNRDPRPVESGVLILLYPEDGTLRTMLMLRPSYDGVHSGQVGFPGGHRETKDGSIMVTALREFTEETGAPAEAFEVLGNLTPVYIPPSNALVTPVVARTHRLEGLAPDPREVAALIPVDVDHLLRDDILKRTRLFVKAAGRELEVPYWDVDGHVVWGATALMIAELRALLDVRS